MGLLAVLQWFSTCSLALTPINRWSGDLPRLVRCEKVLLVLVRSQGLDKMIWRPVIVQYWKLVVRWTLPRSLAPGTFLIQTRRVHADSTTLKGPRAKNIIAR